MNIIIEGSKDVEISSLHDLAKIIPASLRGKALNFGQGEGQVEIEGTIWGMYCGGRENYLLQYEEGLISWEEFEPILKAIQDKIKIEFGSQIRFIVEGKLEHFEAHEKYT